MQSNTEGVIACTPPYNLGIDRCSVLMTINPPLLRA